MKGFDIRLKNEILEPKHVKAMRDSLWLYVWLLDKMTSIDDKQVGKVLGGRPITYQDVEGELGISIREYRRWVGVLRDAGYIETLRTPHGLVITIQKASKFKKRSARTAPSQTKSDVPENESDVPDLVRDVPKPHHVRIKTIQDNTIDTTITSDYENGEISDDFRSSDLLTDPSDDPLTNNRVKPKALRKNNSDPNINGIIFAFENTLKVKLRRPTTQRNMAKHLIRQYGTDDVLSAIKAVALIKDERYAPQILDLQDLWEKWDKLAAFFQRMRRDQENKAVVIED